MKRCALTLWDYRSHHTDKVNHYLHALHDCGLEPVHCIAGEAWSLDGIDAVMLAGGSDIEPALYGEPRDPLTQAPDHPRDAMEFDVIREALHRDLPMLAICRGMQMLNVAFGGTLHQDILGHQEGLHPITVTSRLLEVFGQPEVTTNSRHHQAANRIGERLVVSGRAHDGTVEALELPGATFVVGVQWHPEDMLHDPMQRRLFHAFVESI